MPICQASLFVISMLTEVCSFFSGRFVCCWRKMTSFYQVSGLIWMLSLWLVLLAPPDSPRPLPAAVTKANCLPSWYINENS